ncbi:hypothetical protein MOO44_01450 (plasmid) [Nicoliella spurrieriana]|uniref:Uncharacterized protein n=1 Tax=Nicoliella spurrieriana TaxID=2925830 RepID=A0A976X4Z3_9LACO|nr:hypothetical protein [Nicoliella spurrieriana]UQS86012.1 hypothetical protein MOO44_01450 [Nicoliella spurrieriana]
MTQFFDSFRFKYTRGTFYYPLGTFISDNTNAINSYEWIQLYPTANSTLMFNTYDEEYRGRYYEKFQRTDQLYRINVPLLKKTIGNNNLVLNIGAEFVESVGYNDPASRLFLAEYLTDQNTLGFFYLGGLCPMEAKNEETKNDKSFNYDKDIFYMGSDTVHLDVANFGEFICALDREYFGNQISINDFVDLKNWYFVSGSIMNQDIVTATDPERTQVLAKIETNIPVNSGYLNNHSNHYLDYCYGNYIGPYDSNN